MRRLIIFTLLLIMFGIGQSMAQTKVDTIKIKVKIKELQQTVLALKKKIELEDRKRNQTIDGVSGISMEKINVRQDSICLDLRSQLVDVQLQIKELEFAIKPTKILTSEQATTNLNHGLSAIPAIIGSIPAKPNKPKRKSNSK